MSVPADQLPIDESDDRQADLSAAFDALDEGTDTAAPKDEVIKPEVGLEIAPVVEDKAAPIVAETVNVPKTTPVETPLGDKSAAAGDQVAITQESKAPASWNPTAREEWAKLPDPVKEQIAQREQQMQDGMRESAEFKTTNENVGKLFTPFQQMFQAQGVDAWQGTWNILQMASQLQSGTPQQKAQVTQQLIKDFGVDIKTLDDLLVGNQAAPQTPEMAQLQQQINQQNQWIRNQQTMQAQTQQTQQTQMDGDVDAFIAANEFAGDLAPLMADFMDMAQNAGAPIDLPTAYQRAMATRPDIQQVISNRGTQQSSAQALANANQASVSVAQVSGNGAPKALPESRVDALRDAWDENS